MQIINILLHQPLAFFFGFLILVVLSKLNEFFISYSINERHRIAKIKSYITFSLFVYSVLGALFWHIYIIRTGDLNQTPIGFFYAGVFIYSMIWMRVISNICPKCGWNVYNETSRSLVDSYTTEHYSNDEQLGTQSSSKVTHNTYNCRYKCTKCKYEWEEICKEHL